MGENSPGAGIIESTRRLVRGGMAVLYNRIELFSVEFEEQKLRVVRVLLLAGAAIFLANTALLTVSAAIVILVGENARVAVLVGLSIFYILAALAAFLALRKELRSAPPPFRETVGELKKDIDWLKPR
jgi:uncharacterized membrane protein YqjE